ncbi:MAG: hypothetical protein NC121_07430 [Blautia sp.]|nr:hypothetical protein [Blautia sp.]
METGRRVKKRALIKAGMALLCLTIIFSHWKLAAAAGEPDNVKEYLEKTGMSAQEVEALDGDARQFIADDLRRSGESGWKVNRDVQTLTKTSSEQYTVVFYISILAFQAGEEHRIYAVYESSTGIVPVGNDSLFLGLGDRFTPCEYGGQTWYKKAGDGNWTPGSSLNADRQISGGGIFTGRQLGDFQRKTLVKGCVCCHADGGTGDDNRVTVEYTYAPAKEGGETGLYIMIVAVTAVVVLILRGKE